MKKSLLLAVMLMFGTGALVAQPLPAPAASPAKSTKSKKDKKKGKAGKKGKKGNKKPVTNNSLDPRISS